MIRSISLTAAAFFFARVAIGGEIETKSLPDKIRETKNLDGSLLSQHEHKFTEYYRHGKKILLKTKTRSTSMHGPDAPIESLTATLQVFANERPIAIFRIEDHTLMNLASPWPVYFKDERIGSPKTPSGVIYSIAIPELNFFETFTLKDGELQALPEGEDYLKAKDYHMREAVSLIGSGNN